MNEKILSISNVRIWQHIIMNSQVHFSYISNFTMELQKKGIVIIMSQIMP